MNTGSQPLASIVTPVYNGAEYLGECVESVLAQTYTNWEYTIVDNCSEDDTLAIAQKYAARDPRVRVVRNGQFLSIVENHNHAARQISPLAKYCKFIFADDRLYPTCIEEMVRVAEEYPTIGLVGAYTTDGKAVRWHGPADHNTKISGREICRARLMGGHYVFGTMTSLLVRSDLIRKRPALFNENNLQADLEACFDILQESDFGFVHQILSFSRERANATDSFAARLNSHRLADYVVFLKYGQRLLNEPEYLQHKRRLCRQYHQVLAHNFLRLRPRQFWQFHREALATVGGRIEYRLLAASIVVELVNQLSHPVRAFQRGRQWWSSKTRKQDAKKVDEYRESFQKEATHVR